MSTLVSDVIASVRAATNHDSDTQVTDTQLLGWTNEEFLLLWRELANLIPTFFAKVSALFTISSGNVIDLTAITDFGQVYRFERQGSGGTFYALDVADALNPEWVSATVGQAFLERGTTIEIYPSTIAAGTYRITYLPTPTALAGLNSPIALPDGFQRILGERVSARVRMRFEDDPTPHIQAAADAWPEYRRFVRRRYGAHVQGGLRRVRGW